MTTLVAEQHIPLRIAAQQMAWQDAGIRAIPAIAAQLGPAFGGAWFDPGSGRLNVGVVRSRRDVMPAATLTGVQRAGLTSATDMRPVAWSAAELDAVTAALSPAIGSINRGATTAVTLRTIPPKNVVEMVVGSGPLSAAQAAFLAAARQRYGTRVAVHQIEGNNFPTLDSCSWTDCDPPLRGGVRIDSNAGTCTLGFIVRSNINDILYAMTAGHCVAAATGNWTARFAGGSVHVIGAGHSAATGGNLDAGLIAINDPSPKGWNPRAEVLVLASGDNDGVAGTAYNATYAISGTGGSSWGMRICKTGAIYGTSCGRVVGLNVTGPTGVTGEGEATYLGGHGDSGGPLYAGHIAYGMHQSHYPPSSAASYDSFYVGVTGSASALHVRVATGT